MMKLKELFNRDNVPFPEWLEDEPLKGDWENSTYLKGENIHKWELNTPIGFQSITLEDEEYTFTGYDLDNRVIFEKIVTPESEITS
jgi:hypothetical protein